jgi:uncharacterized protein YwqG
MSEIQLLDEVLKPLIKSAILLKLSTSDTAQAAGCASKFGGLPYFEKNDEWQNCSFCKNELTFVAQLRQSDENSLQTFFYCFECFPWGGSDEETGQWQVYHYQNPSMDNYVAIQPTSAVNYGITPCSCTEQLVNMLPNLDDFGIVPVELENLCGENDDLYEIYDAAVSRCGCFTDYGTLLGGYPKWIQNKTTKFCKICAEEMMFFAQIDSEDQADLMWGDSGAVYLFRCHQHKNQIVLELQCY